MIADVVCRLQTFGARDRTKNLARSQAPPGNAQAGGSCLLRTAIDTLGAP